MNAIFGVNGSLAITEVYNKFKLSGDNSVNSPTLKIPVKSNPVFVAVVPATFDSSRYTGNYNVMLSYVAYGNFSSTPNSTSVIYWNKDTKNTSYGNGYDSEAMFVYSSNRIQIDVSTFMNSATNAVWYTYLNCVVIAYDASAL